MAENSRLLGVACKRARLALGITQEQLAIRCGVDSRTILNIENCRANPSLSCLVSLFNSLHIDPKEVFPESESDQSLEKRQLHLMVEDCNQAEILALVRICETVISTLRSTSNLRITEK